MDQEDLTLRQLNALVGSAVRGLVESGADDEAIGEFAASYREKAAKILGRPTEALHRPDLAEVIQSAVAQALSASGPRPSRRQNDHFTVMINGQKTSITLHKRIVAALTEAKGSSRAANRFIREVARDVPGSAENKSAWVEQRIEALLCFDAEAVNTPGSSRH